MNRHDPRGKHVRCSKCFHGGHQPVAMLGAIESLMSSVVSERMTGDRHNPNVELIAKGLANKTPMAGIIRALTVLPVATLMFVRKVRNQGSVASDPRTIWRSGTRTFCKIFGATKWDHRTFPAGVHFASSQWDGDRCYRIVDLGRPARQTAHLHN